MKKKSIALAVVAANHDIVIKHCLRCDNELTQHEKIEQKYYCLPCRNIADEIAQRKTLEELFNDMAARRAS